ncbi:MAG: dihydrolipoyl dehydrogenase [Myxococcota bacterium]
MQYDVDVAILGAGTSGMSAYREARKYTDRLVLIDGGKLGTTCARVGCMPSKLLIAAANANHNARAVGRFGIQPGRAEVDGSAVLSRLRAERDRFVGFVEDAIDGFDPAHLIRQHASFEDDHSLRLASGEQLSAKTIVIATGSRPSIPESLEVAGDRLITNEDVFEWQDLPESVAVLGAGVIGLELGQALHRLGVRVRLFGRGDQVGPITDPKVREYASECFASEYSVHWNAQTSVDRRGEKILVSWRDVDGRGEESFDYLLAATGRRPNLDGIGLERTSLWGSPPERLDIDPLSGRVGNSHIFIAGDATSELQLLHEAADEGRLAGENAARYPETYRRARRVELAIVFSEPQIALAGRSYRELTESGVRFETGSVNFDAQGRARVMGEDRGILRVYGEVDTGRLLGAEMIGPSAEHLGHLLAWSIEAGEHVSDVLRKPFYHPVLEEGVRTALRKLSHALGFGPTPPLRCIDCGPGA